MTVDGHYETMRAAEIARFSASPPTWVARGFGRALAPVSQTAQKLVPVPAIQTVLQGSHRVARLQFHRRMPLPRMGLDLAECDFHARKVERVAMGLAGGIGAATGLAGGFGAALDVPLVLTLALACIERTACSYGMAAELKTDPDLTIGIFALASANTVQEKQFALRQLDADPAALREAAGRDGLERAAQRQVAKDAAHLTLTQLARQLSTYLGTRKAGQLLPVVGSLVGGSVNAMYLRDVARAAQHVFALRYLVLNGQGSRLVAVDDSMREELA